MILSLVGGFYPIYHLSLTTKSFNDFTQIYIFAVKACLVWFYGISTIVDNLMPNIVYTYILDIYDL